MLCYASQKEIEKKKPPFILPGGFNGYGAKLPALSKLYRREGSDHIPGPVAKKVLKRDKSSINIFLSKKVLARICQAWGV